MNRIVSAILILLLLTGFAMGAVLPSPESVFGFKPGADNRLATYDQVIAYLNKLAAASKSIRVIEAGKTTLGRTIYFALISNPKLFVQVRAN